VADTTQTLQAALEQAALVGSFVPARLLRSVTPQPDAQVFAALGEHCQEVPVDSRIEWTLKPDRRRQVLLALKEEGRLAEVAGRVAPADADAFGRFLSGAVSGTKWDTVGLSRPELGAMHTAMQFARTVLDTAETADTVQRQLARRDADDALALVLPTRLVGRDAELQRLVAFVSNTSPDPSGQPMFVTGFGGCGKSALLAEFTRVMRGPGWNGLPVITLDFDRPSIGSADGIEMILEFSRQLGLHRVDLSSALANFRRAAAELLQYDSDRKSGSFEANASMESRVWSVWYEMLGGILPIEEPVVVILDTFEEVSVRGEEDAAYVLRWLDNLRFEGRVANLRAIVSGRAVAQAEREDAESRHLALDDLDPAASRDMLKLLAQRLQRDLSDELCGRIVRRVGGNALMLRIVSDFLAQEGESAVEDLLQADASPPHGNVLTQAYLYGRILKRIRTDDKDIVKIAHPGLALRRVTADLIQEVLAPTCGLGPISQERAQELFLKLTRQVWLVEPTLNSQVVRHRRHVRTQMMRALSAAENGPMRTVHEAALNFYRDGHERFADRDEARLEACYHSLFTDAPEAPPPGDIKSFVAGLEREIECIPLPGRAVLKLAASMTLSREESASLSQAQKRNYTQQRVSKQLARGHVEEAATSLAEMAPEASGDIALPGFVVQARDLPSEFATKYALGDLRGAADLAGPLLEHYLHGLANGERQEPSRQDFTEKPIWHAAIVLPQEQHSGVAARCAEVFQQLAQGRGRPHFLDWEFNAPSLDLIAALLGQSQLANSAYFPFDYIERTSQLRGFLLLAAPGTSVSCRASLLPYLSRPFLALAGSRVRGHTLQVDGMSQMAVATLSKLKLTRAFGIVAGAERMTSRATVRTRRGVAMQPWEIDLLVGLSPEFHAPLRGLLRQVPQGVLESFVSQCESFPVWPSAMRIGPFRSRLEKDRGRAEADLIATADCLGGLLPFAEYCAAHAADPTPFHEYLAAARRYHAALRRRHVFSSIPQKGNRHADPT